MKETIFQRKSALQALQPVFELTPAQIGAIPRDGNEYLLHVQTQANNTFLASLVNPSKDTNLPQIAVIDHTHTSKTLAWIDLICRDFKRVQTIISCSNPTISNNLTFHTLKLDFNTKKPSINLMCNIQQQTALDMLEWMLEKELNVEDCKWIYALMSRLSLLHNNDYSLLRQMVQKLNSCMAQCREASILIVVVCYVFGQLDYKYLILQL
jgi:hypothetical protein